MDLSTRPLHVNQTHSVSFLLKTSCASCVICPFFPTWHPSFSSVPLTKCGPGSRVWKALPHICAAVVTGWRMAGALRLKAAGQQLIFTKCSGSFMLKVTAAVWVVFWARPQSLCLNWVLESSVCEDNCSNYNVFKCFVWNFSKHYAGWHQVCLEGRDVLLSLIEFAWSPLDLLKKQNRNVLLC